MTSPIGSSSFWGCPSHRLSPVSRQLFEQNAGCELTVSRTDALIRLGWSYCSNTFKEQGNNFGLKDKIDHLLEYLKSNFVEIHVPAYGALLFYRYLSDAAERSSRPLAQLSGNWNDLYPIIAACFTIASDVLEDNPFESTSYASFFSIPVRDLDKAVVEVLNRIGGYRPSKEEISSLNERIDAIAEQVQQATYPDSISPALSSEPEPPPNG